MWLVLVVYVAIVCQLQAANPPPEISNADERYNFFNIELLQAVNERVDGNAVVAPLCVKAALLALVEGTGGRTRLELLSTLRLPPDVSQMRNIARQTLNAFRNTSMGTEISLATRLWTGRGVQVSTNYNSALENYYSGDIRAVNFAEPTNTATAINEWVRQATKNNIRSLVEPGNLNSDMHLLLTSALYFRGRWLNGFDQAATRKRCFQVPDTNGCYEVSMMENTFKYNYASIDSLDADVIEIPYSDQRLSMLVFLPHNEGLQSIHTLSRDLSYTPISVILGMLKKTELILTLPKFSIESKHDLRGVLESMGIKDLFDLSADLSGILPKMVARVGSVLHDAKIEVNEVGTVAAAVTGLSVVPLIGSTIQTFRVDRPFIFAIIDRSSGGILFGGRVVEPRGAPRQRNN